MSTAFKESHCYFMWVWIRTGLNFRAVLKTLETNGKCQRVVSTVGVSQHMHKITNLWRFELNRSHKLRNINERKNTLVAIGNVLSDAWSEVSKSNSWKISSTSKTSSFQKELFFTMFYTINLSPWLVIKKGFMIVIILNNYHWSMEINGNYQ